MSTDVFTKVVYPSVMEVLESGWEQATPEKILVVLVLQRIWGVCMCFPNRTKIFCSIINFMVSFFTILLLQEIIQVLFSHA